MTYALAIRTAPRDVDYFTTMRQRLTELGTFTRPDVLACCVSSNPAVTPNENACRALEQAAAAQADWVLFLEDDVDFIDDFYGSVTRWLRDHAVPAVRYYPLACQYSQCFRPGMTAWEYRVGAYYGSQGLAVRTADVASMVAYVRTQTVGRGFDLALARWHAIAEPAQPHLLTPVPCLIDHMGQVSTLGCAVGSFKGYGGRDYTYRPATEEEGVTA